MREAGSRRSDPLVCEFIYELPRAVSALFRLWLLLLLSGFFCSDWYPPPGTFLELAALLPILIYNSSQAESCLQCLGQYIQPRRTDYWSFPPLTPRSMPCSRIFPSLSLQLSLSEIIWKKLLWPLHTVGQYSSTTWNEPLTPATTGMHPKGVLPSVKDQSQKVTYCTIPFS